MITQETNVIRYSNPSVNSYPISFGYWKLTEIKAYLTRPDGAISELEYGTDYSVSAPDGTGGTLSRISDWGEATILTIQRKVDITQETDLQNGERIEAETVERAFDHSVAISQQLQEELSRCLKTSIDEKGSDISFPNKEARKGSGHGTIMGFDGSGELAVLRDLAQFDQNVQNTAANAASALASKNAAAASEDKAEEWANKNKDVPVDSGKFSAKHFAEYSQDYANTSKGHAENAEAFATGKRNGVDVEPGDPAYHNNSLYYLNEIHLEPAVITDAEIDALFNEGERIWQIM